LSLKKYCFFSKRNIEIIKNVNNENEEIKTSLSTILVNDKPFIKK